MRWKSISSIQSLKWLLVGCDDVLLASTSGSAVDHTLLYHSLWANGLDGLFVRCCGGMDHDWEPCDAFWF